jgi:hypothetical protein
MKAVYSNKSLNNHGRSSALKKLQQDYDIDLSNYYRMSNKERLALLSRKKAVQLQTYDPSFLKSIE